MQGEYRGDFTRDTFWRANHFCQVLMQQGRVQLDADWNEQAAILLHYLRGLGGDLIGQHGGPASANPNLAANFAIATLANNLKDLQIGTGHYYVDGILCEADAAPNSLAAFHTALTYMNQPDFPGAVAPTVTKNAFLVYLDVWERHLTAAQQDSIREVALGGPDTASRSKVIWQVKMEPNTPQILDGVWPKDKATFEGHWADWIEMWQPANRGLLKAQLQPMQTSTDPCVISPQSTYRGTENQLYRVEIHHGSKDVDSNGTPLGPTFKWSRENGSVVFPILKLAVSNGQTKVTLPNLGRDPRLSLQVNDWVEVVDDASALNGTVDSLLQVASIEASSQTVTLTGSSGITVTQPSALHPLLRRWDGTAPVVEDNVNWIGLEDGIQIQFQPTVQGATPARYRSGDYWLIPARVGLGTADGTIQWPQLLNGQGVLIPLAQLPHGVEHHYAPLALYALGSSNPVELRHTFTALAK